MEVTKYVALSKLTETKKGGVSIGLYIFLRYMSTLVTYMSMLII